MDFDDTIVATLHVRSHTLTRTFAALGYRVESGAIRANWGAPFRSLVEALAPGVDFDRFLAAYSEAMDEDAPSLLPGAAELLEYFNRRRVPVVIHSSSLTRLVRQDLHRLGIDVFARNVYGSESIPFAKPDPRSLDPIADLLQEMKIALTETLYVGDSVRDYAAASTRGLFFVGVLSGINDAAEFVAAGCHRSLLVQSLRDLL